MSTLRLDAIAGSVLTLLLSAALRTAVAAGVVAAVLRGCRIVRPSTRLLAWTVLLALCLAMPVLTGILPAWRMSLPSALTERAVTAVSRSKIVDGARAIDPAVRLANVPRDDGSGLARASSLSAPSMIRTTSPWRPSPIAMVAILYLAVAAMLLGHAAMGWRISRRFIRAARPVNDRDARALLAALVSAGQPVPSLLESDRLFVPIATGVLRSAIVLPADWRAWTSERLRAVLVHEVAHIARRDVFTLRLAHFYRILIWFSPVSWWIERRIAALAEEASDDAALGAGVDRAAYAETLLDFVARVRTDGRRAAWLVSMARPGVAIERRLDRILTWTGTRRLRVSRVTIASVVAMASCSVMLAASAQFVTRRAPRAPSVATTEIPGTPAIGSTDAFARAAATVPPRVTRGDIARIVVGHADPLAASAPSAATLVHVADRRDPQTPVASTQNLPTAPSEATRAMAGEMAGRRVWVLMFDQRLSDGDLHKAIAAAIKWTDERLTTVDLVAVLSIGARLEMIQNFTSDAARVTGALRSLESSRSIGPPAVPSGDVFAAETGAGALKLKALGEVCDNLKSIEQRKALMYFSVLDAPGSDHEAELRGAMLSCGRANVQIDTVDVRGLVAIDATQPAPTSPLTVTDGGLTEGGPSGHPTEGASLWINLRNDSAKTVRSVTIAAWAADAPGGARMLAQPPLMVEILPKALLTVTWRLPNDRAVRSLDLVRFLQVVGVVHVEFTDGWSWNYDLSARGGFGR